MHLVNSPVLLEVFVEVRGVVLDAEPAARALPHPAIVESLDSVVIAREERPPVAKVRTTSRGYRRLCGRSRLPGVPR